MREKRAIVVVSFGTTYVESLDTCIVPIEKAVAEAFSSYAVYRAFTSVFVRGRLAELGIKADALSDVLERLCAEGYREVIVAPTHIIAGEEYTNKIVRAADTYRGRFDKLIVGSTLLPSGGDDGYSAEYEAVAEAVHTQIPQLGEEEAVILMAHGSRSAESTVYARLQKVFDACGESVLVGVMEKEDELSLDYVLRRLGEMKAVKKVHLMPFLLVAGCHAAKDMTVWRSRLTEAGYQVVPYLHGLGENAAIRAQYIKRIQAAMDEK